jgi:hypothetical protein
VRAVPDAQQRNATATDVGMVAVAILATGLLGEKSAVWIALAQNWALHNGGGPRLVMIGIRCDARGNSRVWEALWRAMHTTSDVRIDTEMAREGAVRHGFSGCG